MTGIRIFFLFMVMVLVLGTSGCVSEPEPVGKRISDEAFAWNGRGFDAYVQGNYTEALGNFDKAIEITPNFSKAWSNRGMALLQLGRYQEAADAFNKTLEIDPKYPEARVMREIALSNITRSETNFTVHLS